MSEHERSEPATRGRGRGKGRGRSGGSHRGRGSSRGGRGGQGPASGPTPSEPNLPTDDSQPQPAHNPPAGPRRGGARSRGGRGGQGPASGPIPSEPNPTTDDSQPQTAINPPTGPRRGGARPRGRGGARAQNPAIVPIRGPQRTFGGHLSGQAPVVAPSSSTDGGFNVNASEFVPGQALGGHPTGARRPPRPRNQPRKADKSTAPDLPTRIHEDIDNRHYECLICTEDVTRTIQIWTCGLCWAVLHRNCAREWHKQETTKSDPRREEAHDGSWKCPACNSRLQDGIGRYHCWCGKDDAKPNPVKGIPPHSCGQSCSKSRETCPHPCALTCHAGPCPPCTASLANLACYCGKEVESKRCLDTSGDGGWTCGSTCDDFLSCGEHQCSKPCHTGLCGACEVLVHSRCYCGKSAKEMLCEERVDKRESFNCGQAVETSADDDDAAVPLGSWFTGSYECSEVCERFYDCGEHKCEKPCHPQDEDHSHCPLSPDLISRCPCGKTPLSALSDTPRTSCTDEIRHCGEECSRSLPCGHQCQNSCHTGPCKPCDELRDVPCRCGRTSTQLTCAEADSRPTPQCTRPCKGHLNCRKHYCEERCCPADKQAKERVAARRQKRRLAPSSIADEEVEDEHFCERVCGRKLTCPNHFCEFPCHTGPCPTCMEAIWEDVTCACGRTVLEPPQPCGTTPPDCRYPCVQQPLCGHPAVEHTCHPAEVPCPPCSYLVQKSCICGKKTLKNQRCSFNDGRCGLPCGKKLKCGLHLCQKTCHRDGECDEAGTQVSSCTQPCGRPREHCGHPCGDACHEPSDCNEGKSCGAKVALTCECRRLKRQGKCTASESRPSATPPALSCDEECARLKRVAELRDAFSIGSDYTDDHIPYSETTLDLFEGNQSWCVNQESELRDFAADAAKRTHRFKPMVPALRAFLHSLVKDFGLSSESQDTGVNRAVTVLKTQSFVSAPLKPLTASLRLRTLAREKEAEAKALERDVLGRDPDSEHFNAIVLSAPTFGLTAEDLEAALRKALEHPSVAFGMDFRPSGEVVLKAASRTFANALHPANIHETLAALKPGIVNTAAKGELAGGVYLAHVDDEGNITRRERTSGSGGWNEVVRRSGKGAGLEAEAGTDGGAKRGKVTLKLGGGLLSGRRNREKVDWIGKMREGGLPDME